MMMPPPSRPTNSATDALLNDYSDRPLPTPMRTPINQASRSDVILAEALNQRRMNSTQTPLHGDENPELLTGTGFSGAAPNATPVVATPSVSHTPSISGDASVSSISRSSVSATPLVRRDQFGLNNAPNAPNAPPSDFSDTASYSSFASSIRSSAKEERRAAKKARLDLINALNALPEPQFEYELAAPEELSAHDESDAPMDVVVEDAADVEKRMAEKKRLEAEAEYASRSSVAKRIDELPRLGSSFSSSALSLPCSSSAEESSKEEAASAMASIRNEMLALLNRDASDYPLASDKKRKMESSSSSSLEVIPASNLEAARTLLAREGEKAMQADANNMNVSVEELAELIAKESADGASDMVYLEGGWKSNPSKSEVVSALEIEYDKISKSTEVIVKKIEKLEKKLAVRFGGYVKKSDEKRREIVSKGKEIENVQIEKAVFERLGAMEVKIIPGRVEKLRGEVDAFEVLQNQLQSEYASLYAQKEEEKLKV